MDDLPLPNNALHAAFVLSTRPHAKILSIDSAAAEQVLPPNCIACSISTHLVLCISCVASLWHAP